MKTNKIVADSPYVSHLSAILNLSQTALHIHVPCDVPVLWDSYKMADE